MQWLWAGLAGAEPELRSALRQLERAAVPAGGGFEPAQQGDVSTFCQLHQMFVALRLERPGLLEAATAACPLPTPPTPPTLSHSLQL